MIWKYHNTKTIIPSFYHTVKNSFCLNKVKAMLLLKQEILFLLLKQIRQVNITTFYIILSINFAIKQYNYIRNI